MDEIKIVDEGNYHGKSVYASGQLVGYVRKSKETPGRWIAYSAKWRKTSGIKHRTQRAAATDLARIGA